MHRILTAILALLGVIYLSTATPAQTRCHWRYIPELRRAVCVPIQVRPSQRPNQPRYRWEEEQEERRSDPCRYICRGSPDWDCYGKCRLR